MSDVSARRASEGRSPGRRGSPGPLPVGLWCSAAGRARRRAAERRCGDSGLDRAASHLWLQEAYFLPKSGFRLRNVQIAHETNGRGSARRAATPPPSVQWRGTPGGAGLMVAVETVGDAGPEEGGLQAPLLFMERTEDALPGRTCSLTSGAWRSQWASHAQCRVLMGARWSGLLALQTPAAGPHLLRGLLLCVGCPHFSGGPACQGRSDPQTIQTGVVSRRAC